MRQKGSDGPVVKISGDNYELGGVYALVSMVLGYLRMFLFAMMFAGDSIVGALFGGSPPPFVRNLSAWIKENQVQTGFFALLGITMI